MTELRPVELGDEQIILDTWGCHPANFARLTARVCADLDDARRYLANLFPTPQSRAFHIAVPGAGIVGIVKAAVYEHRAQIGYVVHEPFWGQGFATDAVRRITEVVEGMPGISRVWATCAVDNAASTRVLEKCGFDREGILRNWVTYPAQGGRVFDNYSYVKVPRVTRPEPSPSRERFAVGPDVESSTE